MSSELIQGIASFSMGMLLALVIILALLNVNEPSLGERISQGICHRIGGAWDSANQHCIQEY